MNAEDGDRRILCATYTHARRHPLVIGRIAGWTSPVQVSVPQLVVAGLTFWIEMKLWRWWADTLPRHYAVVIALTLPCLIAWAVRRVRVEGRSLPRAAFGWASLLLAPRSGRAGGRAIRHARAYELGTAAGVVVAVSRENVG